MNDLGYKTKEIENQTRWRWLNTIFAHALASAKCIQPMHKDYQNQHAIDTVIILFAQCLLYLCYFFLVIEHSVYLVSVFYYNGMLEMVTMQRTQKFLHFSLLPKEPG